MIPNLRIQDWLQSVQLEPSPDYNYGLVGRPVKRIRVSSSLNEALDARVPGALGTPLSTEAEDVTFRNKKRSGDEIKTESDEEMSRYAVLTTTSGLRLDLEQTPRSAKASLPSLPSVLSVLSPTRRSRSQSPTKSRAIFPILEKPIKVAELTPATLPPDVQDLHCDIEDAVKYRQAIIPHGVKDLLDRRLPSSCFSVAPSTDLTEEKLIHTTLCRIKRAATKSALCQRHEQAWNNLVHTPLLELLCRRENDTEHERPLRSVATEFEPVMAATIAGDSIPRLIGQSGALACSVSSTGESSEGTPGTPKPGLSAANPNQVHSSSSNKKVDYALVLGLPDESALLRRINGLTNEVALRDKEVAPHFNQTAYYPVQYTPIAVSIKTKVQFSPYDPLVQLGIWVAAWHKRMEYLRSQLQWGTAAATQQRLVSLPLIQVIEHRWQMYFACDAGVSITMYGPVNLGSTDDLIALYALFASLKVIKAWVESEFYKGLKRWLKVEE
ncbi:hypothetical protein ONZ43_g3017 [Nemania bipapillata]|uniref:Uncharacterized protein n=1 Tax=Nemania bipapillata TaxID=110536 RepID=A0ACC2IYN4_9PEZI|nr:hypothetical protein ONZ43_g3017 [Nemania bipapillata]